MADISSILTDLLKTINTAEGAKKALEDINNVKLSVNMDIKEIENINRLKKAVNNLAKAQEELTKLEIDKKKEIEETGEISKATYEQMLKTNKVIITNSQIVVGAKKQESKIIEETTRRYEEQRQAIIENWKQNTIQGKVFGAVTGKVAKFTAGITAGAMAMRLLNRVSEAANTRNQIMISGFKDLDDSFGDAITSIWDYEAATRSAQATAIELGMANENTADMMVKYNRIIGTDNPKALGALTEATLAMAKVMNITGAEAMAYVQTRMDNFGGSAANALQHLDELRNTTVSYNKALGGTKVRADDVLKVIQDITNTNNIYAADQRFLSQIMMRTSTTLQAQGESYNYAQRMAENYTKALSSEAPEWMQITNAFDVTKVVKANLDEAGNLLPDFAKKLDAAKPGLSKKVQELLSAGYSEYDVTRLLGDTLKGTDLAMNLMSEKIAQLGSGAGGISRLAAVYGKTHQEAEEMYKSALKTQAIEKVGAQFRSEDAKQRQIGRDAIMKTLGVSKELLDAAEKDKNLQASILNQYAEKKALIDAENDAQKTKNHFAEIYARTTEEIEQAELTLERAKKSNNAADVEQAEKNLKSLRDQRDAAYAEVTGERTGNDTILGALTNKVKDFQKMTSVFTGAWFKAKFEEYSGPVVLGVAAVAAVLWKGFGMQGRMEQWLAAIAENTALANKMRGSSDGDLGGGGGGEGRDYKRARRKEQLRRRTNQKFKGVGGNIRRGIRGVSRGLFGMGGLKGTIKGAGGGLGGLLKAGWQGAGKLGKGAGIVGTVMNAANMYGAYKERGVAGLAGSGIRAATGALGAVGGSLLGPLGTMGGGYLGDMLGEKLGNWAEGAINDYSRVDDAKKILTPTVTQNGAPASNSVTTTSTGTNNTSSGQASKTLDPNGNVTVTLPFMEWMAQGVQKSGNGPSGFF